VLLPNRNCWLQTRYPVIIMILRPCFPARVIWDHHPSPLGSWLDLRILDVHLPRTAVMVPPGWYLLLLLSKLDEVEILDCEEDFCRIAWTREVIFGCQLVLGSCKHSTSACSWSAACAVAFHCTHPSIADIVFTFFMINLNVCCVWVGGSPQCSFNRLGGRRVL